MVPESRSNNQRIAKNTLLLYLRMLIMMIVQLYTSRVVLNTLGIEDYGIYNVVGGIVSMFVFLNTAMTASTQRYITYEIGSGNFSKLKQVFDTSINIHIIISILVVILAETLGLWFLKEKMVLSSERASAAVWVFQLSVLTTIIAIMSYPYNAVIVAHEKMSVFAYISLLEAMLKLAVVFLLNIWNYDKLILYAILIAVIQLVIRFCYTYYCSKHFPESNYHWIWNKPLFKEMLKFAGWNLWGHLAHILFTQGLNILLNIFFGPVINAARAVSVQVQGTIHSFSSNFQMAINPQITKTYAAGQLKEMHKLIFRSSRFTFLLLLIICLPALIEAPVILKVWLNIVPEYTIIFLRLMIFTMIIDSTANPLMIAASATGKVKRYQTVVGGVLLSILPISYVVLKLGGAPWSVFVVHLIVCCIAFVFRLIIIRSLIRLQFRLYFKEVIMRCLLVTCVSVGIPLLLLSILPDTLIWSLLIIFSCFFCTLISSYYLGLDPSEKIIVLEKVRSINNRISH